MIDKVVLQTRLAEAEEALHALLTGTREQECTYNGHRAVFTNAPDSISELRAYIADLKRQLGTGGGRGYVRL